MLAINFYPDPVIPEIEAAANEYQEMWNRNAEKILQSISKISALSTTETQIHAIVREAISQCHPLILRASYSANTKIATTIHELLHRFLHEAGIYKITSGPSKDRGLLSHQVLNLILFDIWEDLYGKDFAQQEVSVESKRSDMYKQAWDWALAMSSLERKEIFSLLRSGELVEDVIK